MLKECPWCGSTKIKYSIKTKGSMYDFNTYPATPYSRYRACYYCASCGAYGPYVSKEYQRPNRYDVEKDEQLRQAAEDRWNNR